MSLKTEDEARKCWCPFARITYSPTESCAVTGNREPTLPAVASLNGASCCIASQCMAWRTYVGRDVITPSDHPDMAETEPPRAGKNIPEHWEWVPASKSSNGTGHWRDIERGYCGLAGSATP